MTRSLSFQKSLLLLMLLPICSRAQTILTDSAAKQLDAAVEGFRQRYHSPSLVLVIVNDQQVVYKKASGYIDVDQEVPATVDSKYPVMSVSKLFTATMLMQLRHNKMLTLEDDVRKYVPEYPLQGTTLLQLATHTAGLPRNTHADLNFTQQIDRWMLGKENINVLYPSTKQELLRSLSKIEREYPVYHFLGYSDRHYSNLGYSILGIAIERAAHTTHAEYVTSKIFRPLQMNSSGFLTGPKQQDVVAKGYVYQDSIDTYKRTPFFQPNSASYAGGIYSTGNDMAKFVSAQFKHNSSILPDADKAMMMALNIGWKPSYPYTFHEGSILGYRSEVMISPGKKIGWVILTNSNNFEFDRVNDVIGKIMDGVVTTAPAIALTDYAGTYQLVGTQNTLKIYLKDGSLYSTYLENDIPAKPLTVSGRRAFKGAGKNGYNIIYEFLTDPNGRVTTLNMGQLMWRKQDSHTTK
ncbi:serine hydrolase [Mucilaginibacter daejeonensis]|uniref:serine hydrolase domain-containing protein n=1 Tax=Mucilaginibacter daejeonensis TaxID=398049 RepID=UPI001D173F70|nr:serine hydrolase domain-containing protein [Mucilaginibacter daejeonensis]UEG51497.1 serine hydrolase [Mucilaginibacter daejeonensis]